MLVIIYFLVFVVGLLNVNNVDKKGPYTKPDKLRVGLRGGPTNSES